MRQRHAVLWAMLVVCVLTPTIRFASSALAQGASAAAAGAPTTAPSGVTLLDTNSAWRCFIVRGSELVRLESEAGKLQPLSEMAPVVQAKVDGKYQIQLNKAAGVQLTAVPPADWPDINFDDSDWHRARGPFDWGYTPKALLCLRGRFEIADPDAAGELTLSLDFHGGVLVRLNGKELTRSHLPAGQIELATPAEDYPKEAYVTGGGEPVLNGPDAAAKYPEQFRLRVRKISVRVPPAMLRKGVNVLAIEVHRAPAAEIMFRGPGATAIPGFLQFGGHRPSLWPRLAVGAIRLADAGGANADHSPGKPPSLAVWSLSVLARVYASDRADPYEPTLPVKISGARNGTFSGQLVISSDRPLAGLSVTAGDLASSQGGMIPASQIEVRYAQLDDAVSRQKPKATFDGLEPSPSLGRQQGGQSPFPKTASEMGTVPVWLTVRVPRDAKPGRYAGQVKVEADGVAACQARVELEVADFALPDARDFVTHVGLIQSPESEAMQYNVPMWSEEHWKRLDRAFQLLGQIGNKEVYIPVIRKTHFGNEHGMVRWVRQADGAVKPDFTIAERYIDLAIKHLGKIPMVVLYCWEPANARGSFPAGAADDLRRQDMPIYYTLLDPATGNLAEAEGPKWGTPQCPQFWKPLFDGMRQLLAKRGMADRMMVGISGDYSPTKTALEDIAAAAPGINWVVHSHTWWSNLHGQPIGCLASVWGISGPRDPGLPADYYGNRRFLGWKAPMVVAFPRVGCSVHERVGFNSPLALYREMAEGSLTSAGRPNAKPPGVRGFARMGADFWGVLETRQPAGRTSLVGRYPETAWGSLNMNNGLTAMLAPGKSGPIATVRLEMLREGLQEAEARVFMEKALADPALRAKLSDDLSKRCQDLLDDRVRDYLRSVRRQDDDWLWFVASGWQERTRKLYALAAEAAGSLGRN